MMKAIVFDIDGTIIDTEQIILKSVQMVLKEETQKEYTFEELRFVLGIPGEDALKKLNVKDADRVLKKLSATIGKFIHESSIFEGMEETLSSLAKEPIQMGIVTSKTKQEVVDEFHPFGLSGYFKQIISASDTEKHKPHPDPLLRCLALLQVAPEETIYIGDAIYDMQCAKGAGVKFALALWGAKTTKAFEDADYILQTPKDILNLVKE